MGNRRKGGSGSVYQDKQGRWYASVSVGGRGQRRRLTAGPFTPTNARAGEAEDPEERAWTALRGLRARATGGAPDLDDIHTVADLGRWWIEVHLPYRIEGGTFAATSLRVYDSLWRNHVVPAIGDVRLAALQRRHVELVLVNAGRNGLTRSTIGKVHDVMASCFQAGVAESVLHRDPAAAVDPPRHYQRQRLLPIEPGQLRALLDVLRVDREGRPSRYANMWVVGVATGARPGEMRGLRWSSVDLDRRVVTIDWQLQRLYSPGATGASGEWVFKRPKGEKVREVLLPQFGVRALTRQREQQQFVRRRAEADGRPWRDMDLVFTEDDGRPVSLRRLQDDLDRACVEVGAPRVTLKVFWRKGFATTLRELGVDLGVIQELLGHENLSTTELYALVVASRLRDAADRLDTAPAFADL